MNFKKRVNGSWADTPNYIHNTSTDTITTLPAVIYPTGTTATVGLKGNTSQQSGTTTPENPIMPQGTGERTGNLFDEDYTGISATAIYKPIYVGNENVTLSIDCPLYQSTGVLFILAGNVSSGISTDTNGVWLGHPKTVTPIDGYVTIAFRGYQTTSPAGYHAMLNTGSTALPYEPYGYKIPISSANTTTPVYLGEVETTRKIKKLVLTGEESFFRDREREGSWRFYSDALISAKDNTAICSHFENIGSDGVNNSDNIGFCIFYRAQFECRVSKSIAGTVNEFKAWLAQQYASGTPVCVWYVLATPETGIVNEPLMKIGDYADTVSGITIPVTAGGDTLSVGTTVQPSEVTVNYKGWHDAAVKEWDGSQWNE